MADDVNSKNVEQVEKQEQGGNTGPEDAFRNEAFNSDSSALAAAMEGAKTGASSLPGLELKIDKNGESFEMKEEIKLQSGQLKHGEGKLGDKDGKWQQGGMKHGEALQKGDKLDFGDKDFGKKMAEAFEKEGVEKLPTGDHIVREDGKESLFTPNGDRITINPDGSHVIKGDVAKVETGKDGTTTVTFGDGAQVSFDQDGFLSVQRGNQGVAFGRPGKLNIPKDPFEPGFPGKGGGGMGGGGKWETPPGKWELPPSEKFKPLLKGEQLEHLLKQTN